MFQVPSAPESTFPTFPLSYHAIAEHCKGKRGILNLIVVLGKKIIHLSNSMTSDPVNIRDWIPFLFLSFKHASFTNEIVCTDGVAKDQDKRKAISSVMYLENGVLDCWVRSLVP